MARYSFYITKKCNCLCDYCYMKKDRETSYTWDEIKLNIDNHIENMKSDSEITIEFIGGEPLLEFNLIRSSVEYLNSLVNVKQYYISTNGTIIDIEKLNYLKQYNVILSISLDGNKEMNNQRKYIDGGYVFQDVINNIKLMLENYPQNLIMIHMTIHEENINSLYKGVLFLHDLGVKIIDFGIVEKPNWQPQEVFVEEFIEQCGLISRNIKDGRLNDIVVTNLIYEPVETAKDYILDINNQIVSEIVNQGNKFEIYNIIKKCVYDNHKMIINI